LPEDMPHVISPEGLLVEVVRCVTGETIGDGEDWDQLTRRLDTVAAGTKRSPGLLVVAIENFNEVRQRVFSKAKDRSRLRNLIDRSESRIMLVLTSASGPVDAEPTEALFGFVNAIALDPLTADDATSLIDPPLAAAGQRLFSFLMALSSGTVRHIRAIGDAVARHGQGRAEVAVADLVGEVLFVMEPNHTAAIRGLGSLAGRCLHDMVVNGEPVSQTVLAERLGYVSQSAVARPVAELKDKHVVVDRPDPASRAKLARVHDRFLVMAYRRRVLRTRLEADPLVSLIRFASWLIALDGPSATADDSTLVGNIEGIRARGQSGGRAQGFKAAVARLDASASPAEAVRVAVVLATTLTDAALLADIADVLKDADGDPGDHHAAVGLLRAAAQYRAAGSSDDALAPLTPEHQVFFRTFCPPEG